MYFATHLHDMLTCESLLLSVEHFVLPSALMLVLVYQTGLTAAAANNQPHVVSWLLGVGADPDKKDGRGKTALQCATDEGHQGIIDILNRFVVACACFVRVGHFCSALTGFAESRVELAARLVKTLGGNVGWKYNVGT